MYALIGLYELPSKSEGQNDVKKHLIAKQKQAENQDVYVDEDFLCEKMPDWIIGEH